MNGAEKIKERIISDARERAGKILEDARLEAQNIIKAAEKHAFQRVAIITEKAKEEAALYKERFRAAGEMDARKSILKIRQEIIDEAFSTAVSRVADLPDDQYSQFMEDVLLNVIINGEGTLVLNNRDRQRLGQRFVGKINEKLKNTGKKAELKLSDDVLDSCGGFIVRYGEMEINCTLEVIINMIRPNLETEVASILFNE